MFDKTLLPEQASAQGLPLAAREMHVRQVKGCSSWLLLQKSIVQQNQHEYKDRLTLLASCTFLKHLFSGPRRLFTCLESALLTFRSWPSSPLVEKGNRPCPDQALSLRADRELYANLYQRSRSSIERSCSFMKVFLLSSSSSSSA